jgi:hypothetical protein
MTAFDKDMQLEAFGAPGSPGNPGGIEHLAGLIIESYEDLLDWAAEIRGTIYPDKMKDAFTLAALAAGQPAEDIRHFIDQVVVEIGSVPAILAQPNPLPTTFNLNLVLTANDAVIASFGRELERIQP